MSGTASGVFGVDQLDDGAQLRHRRVPFRHRRRRRVARDPDLCTLPIGSRFLQNQYAADYGGVMAEALLSRLPLVSLLQRQFVAGPTRSGIK